MSRRRRSERAPRAHPTDAANAGARTLASSAKATGAARAAAQAARSAPIAPRRPVARVVAIDALRGLALALMIVYHFCFDLRVYGWAALDFEHDPFWLGFRGLIVTMFMALVGVSLVLADAAATPSAKFWKRIALIAACALAVSAASYLVFPRTFIYFGILHAIAVAAVLAAPLVRHPRAALAIGVFVVVVGNTLADPAFNARALSWLGFVTVKPNTEDYVPLAPWAGVVLIGIALGHALARTGFGVLRPLAAAPRALTWAGRHSLLVYMLHQPILLGTLGAIALATGTLRAA